MAESLKSSAECLKSLTVCLCYNTTHGVPISHGNNKIFIWTIFNTFSRFTREWFQLCHSKICKKKIRKCHSWRLKTFPFDLQVVSKPFTKTFEKAEKRQFQRFRTFVFQLKIASKPFSFFLFLKVFFFLFKIIYSTEAYYMN